MATIGLDRLYYAKITENENGEETYDTPVPLAKAITAELSVELAEATLYADDGAAEVGLSVIGIFNGFDSSKSMAA
jgi:phi13 family phage major tail protein